MNINEISEENFKSKVDELSKKIVDENLNINQSNFCIALERRLKELYNVNIYVFTNDRKTVVDCELWKPYTFKKPIKKNESQIYRQLKIDDWFSNFKNYIFEESQELSSDYFKNDLKEYFEIVKPCCTEHVNIFLDNVKFVLANSQLLMVWNEEEKLYSKKTYINRSNVSKKELYEHAKKKAKEYWNRDFDQEIKLVNKRWKTLLGLYYSSTKHIELSKLVNNTRKKEDILKTLEHELVHWHLHTSNENFRDVDFRFIEECLKFNIKLSGAKSAQKAYQKYKKEILKEIN